MDDAPDSSARQPSRRQLLIALAAVTGVGSALVPASAGAQTGYAVRSRAQHDALGIIWGYPFAAIADRRRGVDGYPIGPYPQDTYTNHKGVDYFTSPRIGTWIHSVAEGEVTVVNQRDTSALGAYVRVTHAGGVYSEYGHMTAESIVVNPGQRVGRGTPLGLTGWTGQVVPKAATTAHLHLTIQSWTSAGLVVWNPLWLVEGTPFPGPPQPLGDAVILISDRAAPDGLRQALPSRASKDLTFDGIADSNLATDAAGGPGVYTVTVDLAVQGLRTGASVVFRFWVAPETAAGERRSRAEAFTVAGTSTGIATARIQGTVVITKGYRLVLAATASTSGVSVTQYAVQIQNRTLGW